MHNSIKTENELYSFLKKQFSLSDTIRLYYSFIPNGLSNKLERFYSSNTSLWFSRLEVNNDEILYYFGLMEEEKLGHKNKIFPKIILKFNTNINKSTFHLINEDIAILIIKPPKNVYHELNDMFRLVPVSKNKFPHLKYLVLGKINSKTFLKNLRKFIETFDLKIDINANRLEITDVFKDDQEHDKGNMKQQIFDKYSFQRFKFNIKAFEIKNNIEKTNLNPFDKNRLNKYIFKENIDDDCYFNEDFKSKFNRKDDDLFDALNLSILNLKISDYEEFINNMMQIIEKYDWTSKLYFDENEKNEIFNEDSIKQNVSSKLKNNDIDDSDTVESDDVDIDDSEEIVNEFSIDLTNDLINKILLNIDMEQSSFEVMDNSLGDNYKLNLISNLKDYTSNPMFKFNSQSLNDTERMLIINKIEIDIQENRIYGQIKDIVDFYIDQYKLIKNQFISLKFLNWYVSSKSFKNLKNEYCFDENIVDNMIKRVNEDILSNNLEYTDIETKFEIYFRSYETNKKYYLELENYRNDAKAYCIKYNMSIDEVNAIFNKIESEIDNNNGSIDVKYILDKELENFVMNAKNEACDYVNKISISQLMENLKLPEENCIMIKKKTLKLIYNENLRITQITDEFLLELYNNEIKV